MTVQHERAPMAAKQGRRGSKKTRRREPLAGQLDIQAFPHIVDAVLDSGPPEALRALRATSKEMHDTVDGRFCRHVRLSMIPAEDEEALFPGTLAHRVESRDAGGRVLAPRLLPSPHVDVLDVDGPTARMWYEFVQAFDEDFHEPGEGGGWFDEDWSPDTAEDWEPDTLAAHGGSLAAINARVAHNEAWLRARPRLVRYTGGVYGAGAFSLKRAARMLKPDPCAVYFCGFDDFYLGLRKLSAYYEEYPCERAGRLDTVFHVALEAAPAGLPPWEQHTWTGFSDLKLHTNAFTVLFALAPSFLPTVEHGDATFFVELLRQIAVNFVCLDEGRATVVGYERWDIGMLPDPAGEDGLGPGPVPAAPRGRGNAGAAAMGDRIRRWVAIHARRQRVLAQEKGFAGCRPEGNDLDAVKLLTLDEWREEIGEEYFRLMTEKDHTYEGHRELPPFKRDESTLPPFLYTEEQLERIHRGESVG